MNKQISLIPCEACCKGHLHPNTDWDEVEYKGQSGKIYHHYSVCDVCGSELANAKQVLDNKREFVKFRKQIDCIPLGVEIAEMRKRFSLTQAQAGKLFGGGPVAFCKYEHDDILPDEAMSNLLYLAINYEDTIYKLSGRKNVAFPHSVKIDYVSEWLRGKQYDPNESLSPVNEFHKIIKKTFRGKALHVLHGKGPAAKMELENSWNGDKKAWTMQ